MKGVKLPAGASGYLVLAGVAVVGVYAVVKWVIPAMANAAKNAVSTTVSDAATLPATAVNAAGSAVGSTLDAVGNQVLGSAYNKIPATWGGVWADVKGWFGGAATQATPSDVTGADTSATTQDQLGAAAFNQTPDIFSTGIIGP